MTIPALPKAVSFQLIIIRAALLLGLLLVGVTTWYTLRNGRSTAALTPDKAQQFGYIFIGLAIVAVTGVFVLRGRLEKLTDPKQMIAHYMIGYALAEATALFGAVIWRIGGSNNWYIAGLVLMVTAFQVLPVKRS